MSEYSLEQASQFGWSSFTGNLNPERIAFLESHLPQGSIADIGCGPGAWSSWMRSTGRSVVSVDAQAIFLQQAPTQLQRVQASITQLPFPDKSFDAVICLDVLEHIDDDLAALRELVRIARKKVLLAIPRRDDSLDRYNLTFLHWQDRTHRRAYREEDVQNLVRQIGNFACQLQGELPIPLAHMVAELVQLNPAESAPEMVRSEWWKDFRSSPRARIGREDRAREYAYNRLLKAFQFPTIYSGLTAVIDLENVP